MEQGFIDILKTMIKEHGKESILETSKCKAFLADYTKGEYKKESRFLLHALDAKVQKAIDKSQEIDICRKQQVRLLNEDYGIMEDIAQDVFDTLAFVLKGVPIPKPESAKKKSSSKSEEETAPAKGKKTAAKKPAAVKKPAVKKPAAKPSAVKKPAAAKKPAVKKTVAKKPASKPPEVKKPAAPVVKVTPASESKSMDFSTYDGSAENMYETLFYSQKQYTVTSHDFVDNRDGSWKVNKGKGYFMIIMDKPEGSADKKNVKLIYDGVTEAILERNDKQIVYFPIFVNAVRQLLSFLRVVLVIEMDGENIFDEYTVKLENINRVLPIPKQEYDKLRSRVSWNLMKEAVTPRRI
ncbi:MAG: hypothetical protein FWB86_10905 [Treponema sp.]|nr:hypothetical protein [Treponema sp.]MCL2252205.1 hypothetical protein [Treponema sp.]